ncbi:hypothetical protein BLNAU_6226 [Blattamonas nauphoetae]|uniref:Uncharacterized protein n=1 Tax=Blattamonas nauphoetae TaxID=2049346 RepID=A0ABQ9Y4Q9_9EUKA|nr:hypothetical protein BLNAU_6226 [Blattamonas nauphoetae]
MTEPTSIQTQKPWDLPELVSNDLPLYRKLQLVIDSCVGVLQQDDIPDYETELGNDVISDLSRFCYQSFRTLARTSNEIENLAPYLFRASAYSLFGHLIVNAQLFNTRKKSVNISYTEPVHPTFVNVVTGTPGIGKSTCRYPFITLLMSHGVKDVVTKKEGEGTFVFSKNGTKNTGTVNIKSKTVHGPVDFDTPSYLYTYDVDYFPLAEESKNKATEDNPNPPKKDTPYISTTYRNALEDLEAPRTSLIGRVSVPSVEYFPYFVRLLMGTQDSPPLQQEQPIDEDMFITQPSTIVCGSEIAKGSVFKKMKQVTIEEPHRVKERKILLKDSILRRGSSLIQNSTDPGTQFIDEKGNTRGVHPTLKTRNISSEETTKSDQIVEANTYFSGGSHVTLKNVSAKRRVYKDPKTIATDKLIEAGSIIKKGSKIAAGSTLNCTYSIQNSLIDTRWHVIDDHQLTDDSQLNEKEFHVLFSSPKGSRWRTLNKEDKTPSFIIIESTVPKYTPQEEAALLNTIPASPDISPSDKADVQRGVELFSFIPRFVVTPNLSSNAIVKVSDDKKSGIPTNVNTLFTLDVSHKLIHFTCPQFDCNNWHTEFATDLAKRNILHVFGVQARASYVEFLQTMKNHSQHSQQKGAIFHIFVSDAITRGFFIHQPKRALGGAQIPIKRSDSLQNAQGIKLPPTIGEAYVHLRGPSNMSSAELPNLKTIQLDQLRDLPEHCEYLFENCAVLDGVTSRELPKNDGGSNTTPQQGDSADAQKGGTGPLKCFTFYLNPLGGNIVGFDSILLFFQVRTYTDGTETLLQMHKLSVMFIQSTMAPTHGLCDSGPNLMYLWVCLLSTVYGLKPDQIYPHLFYVTPPMDNVTTKYGTGASVAFFMNELNIWEMRYYPEDTNAQTIIEDKGRLMINNVDPLRPNDNPHHIRCYYCGLILEELFVDHRCKHIVPKKAKSSSGSDTAWNVASSDIGIGMFDHPEPEKGVRLPLYSTTFSFNLWSKTSDGDDDRSDDRKRVFEIDLSYPEIGILPNILKSPNTFDMMNVVMVPCKQSVTPYHDPIVVDDPKPPMTCEFTIRPTQPLPNFFSLVPPISKDSIDSQSKVVKPEITLVLATKTNLGCSPKTLGLDVLDEKSHLRATLKIVHLWMDGCQITFSRTRSLTIHGRKVTPRKDFLDLALWNDQRIPICPMHVPTSCFGRLPVVIEKTCRYTLSDLRTLLFSPDQSDSSPTNQTHTSPPPTARDMFINFIEKREQLPPDAVPRLLKVSAAQTPLLPSDLVLLYNRIPRLKKQELDAYDLQLLISLLNGTRNHVSEILERCCECLDSPSKIPNDSSVLENMQLRLDNGFLAAQQRLDPFLNRLMSGNRNFNDFGENSFEFKCLEDDALLPRWHQSLLIPWIMNDILDRATEYSLKGLTSDTLQPLDKWVLIAAMMVHAPIDQSEQECLNSAIKGNFRDQSQNDLLSLVNHYSEQSLEQVVCQSTKEKTVLWKQTLRHLRMNRTLILEEADFLCALFSTPAQKPENTKQLIQEITCCCSISWKDQETLTALVNGLPRLTDEFRRRILPKEPDLTDEERKELTKKIEQSTLSETEQKTLVSALKHDNSLTFEKAASLNEITGKISLSDNDKQTLIDHSFHTLLLCSDSFSVFRYISDQLTSTQESIPELFEIFRGTTTTPLDEKRKDTLKITLNEIRSRIDETHRLLFERLNQKQLSRKDYAGLLCCPNGGRSFCLPGLGLLFPESPTPAAGLSKLINQSSTFQEEEENATSFDYFETPISARSSAPSAPRNTNHRRIFDMMQNSLAGVGVAPLSLLGKSDAFSEDSARSNDQDENE